MILRGGGWKFVCMFGGLWKIGKVKGEDVKSGNKTKGLITWAGTSLLAMNSLHNEKGQWPVPMVREKKRSRCVLRGQLFSKGKI